MGGTNVAKKSNMDAKQIVIQMKDIVKKFGDFTANDHINLTVHKGEVHAILGENGAGKSTLMNVLYGMYHQTSGTIEIDGKEVDIDSPQKAISLGIGMVHQHFMLVQPFTVTENIILGEEPMKGIVVDLKKARQQIVDLSEKYNLKVDPDMSMVWPSVAITRLMIGSFWKVSLRSTTTSPYCGVKNRLEIMTLSRFSKVGTIEEPLMPMMRTKNAKTRTQISSAETRH